MTSFFTILFIVIGVNAVMMIFSLRGSNQKSKKSSVANTESSSSQIYPIDLISSKYKKAV